MSTERTLESAMDKWTILRAGTGGAGPLEVPSLPLNTGGPTHLRAAIGLNGEARLLLPLTAEERVTGIDGGNALAVSVSSFLQSGRPTRFLDLTCLSRDLEPVFAKVVDAIVGRVSEGSSCSDAVRTALHDFRALLVAKQHQDVQRSQLAGLLAELLVLNRLLDISPRAWRTWRGPEGDRNDFRAGNNALEIKASTRAGIPTITVHGLEQLEPPSNGALHLVHFVLEPSAGGMLTIEAVGTSVLRKADDPDAVRILMSNVGCPDVASPVWNKEAFRIESESLYSVGPDFPRLVPSMLPNATVPPGIRGVEYQLDLAAASRSLCTVTELDELLRTLAKLS